MAMTYSGKITTPKTCPAGVWSTIIPSLPFPAGSHVDAMVYINVSGSLGATFTEGIFDVRAIRTGTADDTALITMPAKAGSAGGAFTTFVTHTWFGANPGAFTWQIRPRTGITKLQVNTRYAKGKN